MRRKDEEKRRKEQEKKDKEYKKRAEEERRAEEEQEEKDEKERQKKIKQEEKKRQEEINGVKKVIGAIAKEERKGLPYETGEIKSSLTERLFGKGKSSIKEAITKEKKPVPETGRVEAPIIPKPVSRWDIIGEQEKRRKSD